MTTGFLVTVQQLTDTALRKLGVNIQGGTATSTQVAEATQALNMMAKRFFTLGMPYYREYTHSLSLVAGTSSYAVSPDSTTPKSGIWNIYQAFLKTTSTSIEVPLRVITREEYHSYTNKTQQGIPVALAPSADGQTVYLYLTPDTTTAANQTITIYGYKQEDTYTAASDNILFPQEWYEALLFGLCWRLCPEYGVDAETTSMWKDTAEAALKDAVNWVPEMNSTYFGKNSYGWVR